MGWRKHLWRVQSHLQNRLSPPVSQGCELKGVFPLALCNSDGVRKGRRSPALLGPCWLCHPAKTHNSASCDRRRPTGTWTAGDPVWERQRTAGAPLARFARAKSCWSSVGWSERWECSRGEGDIRHRPAARGSLDGAAAAPQRW